MDLMEKIERNLQSEMYSPRAGGGVGRAGGAERGEAGWAEAG